MTSPKKKVILCSISSSDVEFKCRLIKKGLPFHDDTQEKMSITDKSNNHSRKSGLGEKNSVNYREDEFQYNVSAKKSISSKRSDHGYYKSAPKDTSGRKVLKNVKCSSLNGSPKTTVFNRSPCQILMNLTPTSTQMKESLGDQTPMTLRKQRNEAPESKVIASKCKSRDSGSESGNETKSESGDNSAEESIDTFKKARTTPSVISVTRTPREELNNSVRRKIFDNDCDYALNADEYFRSKREQTSNNTMRKFHNFNVDQNRLKRILTSGYVRHQSEIENLNVFYESQFRKWLFYLNEGYNLLMYGLGSKIQLVEKFVSAVLPDCHIVKAKGFFSNIVMRSILRSIIIDIFGESRCPVNVNDAVNTIAMLLKKNDFPIFMIIYNLDGPAFRHSKHQAILSKLACLPNLHMVATIDHINTPLLWGNKILGQFNFAWLNVTTYEPYVFETYDKDALQMPNSSDDGLISLMKIYNGCSEKMKKIFKIIVQDNLKSRPKHYKYKGIRFQDLYSRAKRELLVSDPRILSIMLKDFYEHEVIKQTADDYLTINTNRNLLDSFYKEQYGEDG